MVLWFYGFMALWLYSLMACWFYGFMVLDLMVVWFYGFLVARIYQVPISCFLMDLEPISKVFKISLDGSSGFVGARLFQNREKCGFPSFRDL